MTPEQVKTIDDEFTQAFRNLGDSMQGFADSMRLHMGPAMNSAREACSPTITVTVEHGGSPLWDGGPIPHGIDFRP